jgi:hypothetical protein
MHDNSTYDNQISRAVAESWPDDTMMSILDGRVALNGSGDTLAEFVLREIHDVADDDLSLRDNADAVVRALRNAIDDLEEAAEAAGELKAR